MRPLIFTLIFVIFVSCSDQTQKSKHDQSFKAFVQKTRLVDTAFVKTVKLNDITVCSSTITDIKQLGYNPFLIPKEQIDSLIAAVNWQEGEYYYDKAKNLFFCTYDNSELLSSIFLKDNFGGILREVPISDFSRLTVHDITSYFKDLHWSTTGVSDYWIYGNDTVNFYIKIDKSIPLVFL